MENSFPRSFGFKLGSNQIIAPVLKKMLTCGCQLLHDSEELPNSFDAATGDVCERFCSYVCKVVTGCPGGCKHQNGSAGRQGPIGEKIKRSVLESEDIRKLVKLGLKILLLNVG